MGPSQSENAIVLRSRPYGESDKIVTFLTEEAGKLTGIAKGAKNSRRRFANCLDPFTRVRVHYRTRPNASLVFVDSCDLVRPAGMLTEPTKFAYGSYLIELVDQLTADAHPVVETYHLLVEALDALEGGRATGAFLRAFELQALRHAGYDPQLRTCAQCHAPVVGTPRAFLEPRTTSIMCTRCHAQGESGLPVTGATLALLQDLKATPLERSRSHCLPPPLAAEAAQLMGQLLSAYLHRPLRSLKLIAALSD